MTQVRYDKCCINEFINKLFLLEKKQKIVSLIEKNSISNSIKNGPKMTTVTLSAMTWVKNDPFK